jgi:hypothetical protein
VSCLLGTTAYASVALNSRAGVVAGLGIWRRPSETVTKCRVLVAPWLRPLSTPLFMFLLAHTHAERQATRWDALRPNTQAVRTVGLDCLALQDARKPWARRFVLEPACFVTNL